MGIRTWMALGAGSLAVGLTLTGGNAAADSDAENQAQIELGRRLFLDPTVSNGGKTSCAACHDPEHGFSDESQFSQDDNTNTVTARHSQPMLDLESFDGKGFHWDGEFKTLKQLLVARLGLPTEALAQARALLTDHFEESQAAGKEPDRAAFDRRLQSLTPPYYGPVTPRGPAITPIAITQRLTQDERYDQAFELAYRSPEITTDRIIDAMEKYLLSIRSTESPYDRFRRGDKSAVDESAQRGAALFRGKAACAECHVEGDDRALSDGKFHNTGVAYPFSVLAGELKDLAVESTPDDAGRSQMSFSSKDTGQFKTPSLRDVALRAPYMHDGGLPTLERVVEYYNKGGTQNSNLDGKITKLGLTDGEVADIVAFLNSLTGEQRPGLGPVPRYRAKSSVAKRRFRIESLSGGPMKDLSVLVTPVGDRLAGTDAMPRPFRASTDRNGDLEFDFPLSTHVKLVAEFDGKGYEIGETRMLPDTMSRGTFVATPVDTVSVRVRFDASVPTKSYPASFLAVRLAKGNETSADRVTFTRVRALGRNEVLYTAPVGDVRGAESLMRVALDPEQPNQFSGTFEMDLEGGASEPIDLRPLPSKTVDLEELRRIRNRRTGGTPQPPARPTPGTPPSRRDPGTSPGTVPVPVPGGGARPGGLPQPGNRDLR